MAAWDRWESLGERERRLLTVAGALVALALIWLVAIKPAWTVLTQAQSRLDAADAQTLAMQRLAVETRELRAATQVTPLQSLAALKAASDRLGATAKLAVRGDRATLTVENIDVDMLRNWLAEIRSGARARVVDVQLARGPKGYAGTVTVSLGAAP